MRGRYNLQHKGQRVNTHQFPFVPPPPAFLNDMAVPNGLESIMQALKKSAFRNETVGGIPSEFLPMPGMPKSKPTDLSNLNVIWEILRNVSKKGLFNGPELDMPGVPNKLPNFLANLTSPTSVLPDVSSMLSNRTNQLPLAGMAGLEDPGGLNKFLYRLKPKVSFSPPPSGLESIWNSIKGIAGTSDNLLDSAFGAQTILPGKSASDSLLQDISNKGIDFLADPIGGLQDTAMSGISGLGLPPMLTMALLGGGMALGPKGVLEQALPTAATLLGPAAMDYLGLPPGLGDILRKVAPFLGKPSLLSMIMASTGGELVDKYLRERPVDASEAIKPIADEEWNPLDAIQYREALRKMSDLGTPLTGEGKDLGKSFLDYLDPDPNNKWKHSYVSARFPGLEGDQGRLMFKLSPGQGQHPSLENWESPADMPTELLGEQIAKWREVLEEAGFIKKRSRTKPPLGMKKLLGSLYK